MADAAIPNPFDGLQGLFDKIIGSKTVGTDQQSLTTAQTLQNLLTTLSTQNQNTNTAQQQTSNQTNTSTTSNNADISSLQQVLAQQQAGITPDMLKAIFTEGAKAVPQLVATTANAAGARSGDNSSLETALRDLNTNLTATAASQSQAMRNAAAGTAAQIADLTKQQTTTGTTTGSQNLTSDQVLQNLLNQTQTQNQTTDINQAKRDDSTSTTGINSQQTGIAAGLAGLASLLGSNPSDLLKSIPGLSSLFGGGTVGSANPSIPQDPNADSNPDLNGSVGDVPTVDPNVGTVSPLPMPDMGVGTGDIPGFADGGVVTDPNKPKLLSITDTPSSAPNVSQLLGLLGGSSSGTAGTTGSGGTGSGGVDLNSLLAMTQGAGNAAGVGNAANPGQVGPNVSPAQMFNLIPTIATMNPVAIGLALAKLIATPTTPASSGTGTTGTPGNANASPTGPVGTVSVGPATASDADTGAPVGVDAGMSTGVSVSGPVGDSADSGDAPGTSGDAGDGSGGAGDGSGGAGDGGGGWADGGVIPKLRSDSRGIMDPLTVKLSGGEAIVPTDVVDLMGPDFFNSIISLYHTPAAVQKTRTV